MDYDVTIGLEVHAQLLTQTKIFCGCSTVSGSAPNTNTCPVCMGMPGVLPVLNQRVVDFGIKLGLALGATVAVYNVFARKNYFYPDLPKGYQITQYDVPLALGGALEVLVGGTARTIGITRVHMEEDAGKLVHDEHEPVSYVDYNRAGVPLLEIVSEPDLTTPEEAAAYLRGLRQLLVYLEICDGNMEAGSLRCDANISLKPKGSTVLGTRTEIKNINSFKFVQRALEYEIERHREVLDSGQTVEQETRLFDSAAGVTRSMRSKEESHDYRYFPEPDLIPLQVGQEWVREIQATLPELPLARRNRFMHQYGLSAYDADILTLTRALADYYEQCVNLLDAPKEISNWIMTEVLRVLKDSDIATFKITPGMLTDLIKTVRAGSITGATAKEVFDEMAASGTAPDAIIASRGLTQIADQETLVRIVAEAIANHPKEAEAYRKGKTTLAAFFVGKVMQATKGRANPQLANALVREQLGA